MINTKNVFKKLLGLSLSAIIAVTSLGGTAAFASDGRLSDKSINDIVKYRATDTGFFTNNANAVSKDGDALKIQSSVNKNNEVSEHSQPVTRAFALDKSGDVLGSFSFDIKAGENNTNQHSLLFAFRNPDDPNSDIKPVFFIIGENGFLGSQTNPSWTYNPTDIVQQYTKGQYYKIGIVFNKDYTYDIYVDGTKLGRGVISAENQRAKLDAMTNIDFMIAVHDNTKNADNRATFYMKDIMWQVGGGTLVAETEKSEYVSGDTAAVKFSAPIMNKDEVSKVKLFESATGAEQSAAAVFDGDNVNVTLPNNLKSGREYRIELPEFKDCLGNTLTNDNVYFNVAASSGSHEVIDFFESFESMGSGTKAKPNGWNRSNRGEANEGFSEKADNNGNAVLKLGHDGSAATGNPWRFVTMWYDLGTTFTTGKLTMSYDIAPSVVNPGNWQSDTLYDSTAFFFYALSSMPDNADQALGGGAVLSGQLGSKLGGAKTKASPTNENKSDTDSKWATGLEVTDGNLNTWHSVKMVLDLDNYIYEYYFDGKLINTSTTLFDDVYDVSDYSKIKDGIRGIGLGTSQYAKKSEQLIDNIKVSHSTNKALGESVDDFSEDWSGYTYHAWTADDQWTQKVGCHSIRPANWGHRSYGWEGAALSEPVADENGNIAMKMGLCSDKEWGAPELYHPLNEKYTSGIITVDYDVKAERIVSDSDEDYSALTYSNKSLNAFNFTIYSEKFDDTQMGLKEMADGKKYSYPGSDYMSAKYGRRAFSITNGEMLVNKTSGADAVTSKQISAQTWYSVRHVMDIDNNRIETYIKNNNNYELLGVTPISGFDYTDNNVTYFDHTSIGGIGFAVNEKAYLSDTRLDNISVKYTPFKSSKGISAVRFSDYSGIAYGSASETTTLADTIAISFTDAPDVSNADISLYETANPTKTIGYTGTLSETADNVYIMNLNEFLTANTEYTLKVDGVTCGGEAIEAYTHKITAEKNGELVIEPMKISVNGSVKSDGENYATETLKSGDTVETSVVIINTTGTKHEWAFSSGVYKNKMLNKFDYRMISLDGTSADGKYAKAVCTFNIDDETVKDLTKIRAYLWNGMTAMQPQSASCDLICGAAK